MSESHLQVNLDGTTAKRKTALWPNSKKEQEPIVRSLFEHNNWKVSEINHQSGPFWKVITTCNENTLKINLYISSVRDEDRYDDEFKIQLNKTNPKNDEEGWITLILGIYTIAEENKEPKYILSSYDRSRYDFSANSSLRGTRTEGLQRAFIRGMFKTKQSILFRPEFIYYYIYNYTDLHGNNDGHQSVIPSPSVSLNKHTQAYLVALRTKPFMLLAGISGTGKSRLVRELAFKSCPEYLQDKDGTTPGNYCMIEVKPNWHDSTELLGYYSNINKRYIFTKFVKFLVKAKMFPNVPFFVCLDEMNLAPVEQYFAEVLSILETRKHPKNAPNKITTEVIVDACYFKELGDRQYEGQYNTDEGYEVSLSDRGIYRKLFDISEDDYVDNTIGEFKTLVKEGLTLPDNVLIIGTVNMDDTTHQFSRKVIDRAMTIEMNGGKLAEIFGGSKDLEYLEDKEQKKWQNAFKQLYVSADEVLEQHPNEADIIMEKLPERLEAINQVLKGTPFEVSYRVLNELTIMVGVMLDEEGAEADIDDIINQAVDNILLMKILPRIEGDNEMFAIKGSSETKLDRLKEIAPDIQFADDAEHRQTSKEKIQEMIDRLQNQGFTRFWP